MEYGPEESVSMRKVFSIKCFRLLSDLEIYVISLQCMVCGMLGHNLVRKHFFLSFGECNLDVLCNRT